MAARDNDIGACKCPVCGHKGSHLRFSKKLLAYVVCNHCNCQVMARSERSDELLRRLHVAEAPPAPEPVRTVVAPVGDVQTNVTPAAAPVPPARPKPAWGFGGLAR